MVPIWTGIILLPHKRNRFSIILSWTWMLWFVLQQSTIVIWVHNFAATANAWCGWFPFCVCCCRDPQSCCRKLLRSYWKSLVISRQRRTLQFSTRNLIRWRRLTRHFWCENVTLGLLGLFVSGSFKTKFLRAYLAPYSSKVIVIHVIKS